MSTFEDLAPLTLFGDRVAPFLRAVGWIGADAPFDHGRVSSEFYHRLGDLISRAFQPVVSLGFHSCELCQFDGPKGSRNLFVPNGDHLFVCPELVLHYVAAHAYRPPDAFQEAVMRCPDPAGNEYRRQFLDAGGRALLASRK